MTTDRFGVGLAALIVSDDPETVRIARSVLATAGFGVATAASLALARRHLLTHDVAVLLVDDVLPDGSGLELARELAERPDCDVVVLSAEASVEAAVEAMRNRAADYLAKPLAEAPLTRRLRRVLDSQVRRRSGPLVGRARRKSELIDLLATRDPVTGLLNHSQLQQSIEREVQHGSAFALLLIDIDGFADINRGAGHEAGDRVLRQLGGLLGGSLQCGGPHDGCQPAGVAARFDGDSFAVLLPGADKDTATRCAEGLRQIVAARDLGPAAASPLTVSLGVSAFPDDADSREALLTVASIALRLAKQEGGNRVVTYEAALDGALAGGSIPPRAEPARLAALERVLAQRIYRTVFQPIVDGRTRKAVAFEALTRVDDATLSSPLELVGIARRSGRIAEVGRLLRARAAAALPSLTPARSLFLNVDPDELQSVGEPALEPQVAAAAQSVVLELTESARLVDDPRTHAQIRHLRELGYRIALDDLGAGYSTLSQLALLEPDFVKLDMVLVHGVRSDSRKSRLIQHLVEFCAGEGMTVVAEGIETAEEMDVVLELGVPLLQGYYLGPPAELSACLRARSYPPTMPPRPGLTLARG